MHSIVFLSPSYRSIRSWCEVLGDHYTTHVIQCCDEVLTFDSKTDLLIIDTKTTGFLKLDFLLLKSQFGKVLVIGDLLDEDKQIKVILDGASGYVEKTLSDDLIPRVVDSVLRDEIWLGRQLIPKMIASLLLKNTKQVEVNSLPILSCLTEREKEVIKYINCGEANQYIADKMFISNRTVKAHLAAIYRKLEVEDRFQLVVKLKDAHIDAINSVG